MSLWGDLGRTFQAERTTSTKVLRWSKPGVFIEWRRLVSLSWEAGDRSEMQMGRGLKGSLVPQGPPYGLWLLLRGVWDVGWF